MSEEFPAEADAQPVGFAAVSRLAHYHLEERIGAGGMAVVFRARDERLQRRVALKILAPALAADEAFRYRFIRESQAAAAVDDPHIIPVFEAGEADGVLFLAMRYVAGGDVRTLARREGPLSPGRALAIISPVASALDAGYRRNCRLRRVRCPHNACAAGRRVVGMACQRWHATVALCLWWVWVWSASYGRRYHLCRQRRRQVACATRQRWSKNLGLPG